MTFREWIALSPNVGIHHAFMAEYGDVDMGPDDWETDGKRLILDLAKIKGEECVNHTKSAWAE